MKRVKNRNKPVRLLVTGLLCLVLLITLVPRTKSVWDLSLKKKDLEKEKARLELVNKSKQNELDELGSPDAIERIAREKLGMVKEGERFIVKVIEEK
jgi:cell division protein FtsB